MGRRRSWDFLFGLLLGATIALLIFLLLLGRNSPVRPTLHAYNAHIILYPNSGSGSASEGTLIHFQVSLNFEVPKGQSANYEDRIKGSKGIVKVETVPPFTIRNPLQYPGNSTLLEFMIEPTEPSSRMLLARGMADIRGPKMDEQGKVGPHIPYFAECVFVLVDYSRISKEPLPLMRAELETAGKDGIRQLGSPTPELKLWKDGLATITAINVPQDSEIVLRWGH
ncbi:MAG TPA: hypothetical protein VK673_14845 [Chthoniobacterales bacterium]|nr:hypothetical protein [Chthoniobacterales bacterium]